MPSNFVELQEAARMLGVTPDELVEMRSQGDIYGYRDGASWKFKTDELERVAQERGISLGGADAVDDVLASEQPQAGPQDSSIGDLLNADLDLDSDSPDDADSLLVADEQLAPSGDSNSSTIIGDGPESDLLLADDVLADEGGMGSSVLASEPLAGPGASDVKLISGDDSDVKVVPDSDDLLAAPDSDGAGTGDLELTPSSGTGDLDLSLDSGTGDLELTPASGTGDLDIDSDLSLDSGNLELGGNDDLSLSDDDDLVLGDSGAGSDVTLGTGDTGINLTSPSDSGLSLEEDPIELGSSVSSLELPEEEALSLEEDADPDAATQLRQDEEFLLSPADSGDEDDSGSQVIQLEDSAAFDQDAATMLDGDAFAQQPEMQPGLEAVGGGLAPAGMAAAPVGDPTAMAMADPGAASGPAVPEAPYSIWNVLVLLLITSILGLSGMLMVDIVRNMWAWNGAGSNISTSIMDGLLQALKLRT